MRGATECARRLKLLFSSLRSKLGKVGHPPITDPITQLILGVLSRDTPETKAAEGLARVRGMVVDYNELRVIPPIELAETLSDFPDARLKCEDISRALNSVFSREHAVSLEGFAELSKKDLSAALAEIDGIEPYTRARIRLLALQKHAIPLDEAMWALARAREIVAPDCSLDEAQRFLERRVAEQDALEFFALMKKQAWAEMGAAVKKRQVERITSVPPDRTSRNMLQMVTRAISPDEHLVGEVREPTDEGAPCVAEAEPRAEAAASGKLGAAPAGPTAGGRRGAKAADRVRNKDSRASRSARKKKPAANKAKRAAGKAAASRKKHAGAAKSRAQPARSTATPKRRSKRSRRPAAKAKSA